MNQQNCVALTKWPADGERTNAMKRIATLVAESGDLRDLAIHPGTTSREILNQMGLDDRYTLSSPGAPAPFGDDENVYETVSDGAKLVAATPVEVGN